VTPTPRGPSMLAVRALAGEAGQVPQCGVACGIMTQSHLMADSRSCIAQPSHWESSMSLES
jgi:hypothetical protein